MHVFYLNVFYELPDMYTFNKRMSVSFISLILCFVWVFLILSSLISYVILTLFTVVGPDEFSLQASFGQFASLSSHFSLVGS